MVEAEAIALGFLTLPITFVLGGFGLFFSGPVVVMVAAVWEELTGRNADVEKGLTVLGIPTTFVLGAVVSHGLIFWLATLLRDDGRYALIATVSGFTAHAAVLAFALRKQRED